MNKAFHLFLIALSPLGLLAQFEQQTASDFFQRLLVDESQEATSLSTMNAFFAKNPSLQNPTINDDSSFAKRLATIVEKTNLLSEYFEYFSKPTPQSHAQKIHFTNAVTPRDFIPVNIRVFPVEMLEAKYQKVVEDYPTIYQELLELKVQVDQSARELLNTPRAGFSDLESSYSQSLKNLFSLHQSQGVNRRDLVSLMKAAQMPTIGYRSPPGPRIAPEFIYLFEMLALSHSSIPYKIELAACIASMDASMAAPCMGMLLQQALYAQTNDFEDTAMRTYLFQLFDYFKNHPSRSSAVALSEAIERSDMTTGRAGRYLSARLASPGWQQLLSQLDQDGSLQEHTRRLRAIASRATER